MIHNAPEPTESTAASADAPAASSARPSRTPADHPGDAESPFGPWLYGASWFALRTVGSLFWAYKVVGEEHIPKRGPFLLACNHVSNLDPPFVAIAARRWVRVLAKAELFKVPVLGAYLRTIGVIPVTRGRPDRASLRRALGVLERGAPLLIFPEGTRSATGELGEGQRGAAMIWARSGVPMVPAYIAGSQEAMPRGAGFPRPGRMTVHLGPAVLPPGDFGLASGGGDTYQRLAEFMMRRIRARQAVAEVQERRR